MSQTEHSPELYCPECGYDLRAMTEERCPECGLAVDRETIAKSQIPWTHRAQIGRVSAFIRTVWFVFSKPQVLARQSAKSVSYEDAQKFRWMVVLAGFIPLAAAALIARWLTPTSAFVILPAIGWPVTPVSAWFDVLTCFMAGIAFWAIPSIAIFLFLAAITGIPSFFFHPRDLPVVRQNRAIALSYYCCAPLTLMFIPIGLFGLVTFIQMQGLGQVRGTFELGAIALVFGAIFSLLTIPYFLYRSIQLLGNTTHCTLTRLVVSAILIPVLWILMAGLCLGVFPMLTGLIRLMIESVRQ